MFRISNFLVGLVNCLVLAAGLAGVCFSIYFHLNGGTQCQRIIQNPLSITSAVLVVVAVLGLIGACCKNNFVMVIYLAVLFLVILALIAFTVFVFLVTNDSAGKVVSDKGFKEYRTWDFSTWLRRHFVQGKNWEAIRTCLVDAKVCRSLSNDASHTMAEFYKKNLSPIQSGCCKPPKDCGFEFKNATWWVAPKTGVAAGNDGDCKTWSNIQTELCYQCNTCKEGVLFNIRKEWRHIAIFNVCLLVVIILVYTFGCCARRNNRRDNRKGHMV
ncbi:tetraspanin-11-like [Carica papaya]|uniref:tetraspanin-11-like n=1 Tax=Carica papaya TaxID=3649 RepID=UPI000B8D1BE7|nr:tetraspanin-11-like [Carica papaya]